MRISPGELWLTVARPAGNKSEPGLLASSHPHLRAQYPSASRSLSASSYLPRLSLNAQLRVLVAVFALLFAAFNGQAQAAIGVDTTTSASSTASTTLSWTHTTGAGINRLLVVTVVTGNTTTSSNDATTVTSVTYGGVALTLAGSVNEQGDRVWGYIYYLVNPAVGAGTVAVNLAAASPAYAGATTLTGVNTTNPIRSFSSNTEGTPAGQLGGASSASLTGIASATDDLIVDVLGVDNESITYTLTPGAGQSELWSDLSSATSFAAGGIKPGSATESLTWAWSPADLQQYVLAAASVEPATTTLATGTDPSNTTLAPGASASMADAFTFQSTGTDTITALNLSLGTGASAGVSLVEITDSTGATVYGSVSNPSDTPTVSLSTNITVSTSATTYKIRVTPKSHASMAAPAGATYTVTAHVTGWTGSNLQAGSDTAGATITIDNLSPGNVSAASVSAGNGQTSLSWTNPGDADLGSIVVLRRTVSAVTDVPVEGTTYSVGNTIGSSTVACVVSAPTTSCTDTGLTNGSTYYYKIFTKDTNGNYSATGVTPTGSPVTLPLTTLATGTDPSNVTLAPGGAATMADAFTFQTAIGTDTITAITVSLGTGASAGVGLVEITDSTGATVYGSSSNPASDTPAISLSSNITATTSATTYKIRVTPKSHAAMPAPGGATYTVTALVSGWTGTNPHAGSDTAGATITIDNLSPGNVTSATATAGNTQVSLAWTNPGDADLSSIIVLRRTVSAVTDTPVEGTTYSVGNTIGSSTVACVVSTPTASCTDTGLSNGTAYYYKIFTKDSNGNYSANGATPAGSPVTPNVTTLATGTDPSNTTIAPGASATMADAFTFQTAGGTDTITAITVSLGTGASTGLSLVEITDSTGATVYGSVSNPPGDTPTITLSTSITATSSATTYKIRVTPKSHAAMAAPAGATYTVTALVSGWTGTNVQAGSDTAGATITVDNASPANVTSASATGSNGQVSLSWTNPADADLGSIVVLRRTVSVVTDTPVEGTTYSVGNTIGSSTVACVVSAPTTTCTDTGLSNGSTYYYKVFAQDTRGNYSANGVVPTGSPVTPNATTLATGTDPANTTLAPGASATFADAFTFQTGGGTDTITAVTVSLGTGAASGLSLVEITDSTGATVYGSTSNPVSDTPSISLSTNITATTSATTYKIRVTPKSHASMAAPAGATYTVTALLSGWTGTNAHAGSDTAGATITIDNQSPGDVTSASATGGNNQASLAWSNPADADLGSVIVLRSATGAVADTPVEGTTYSVGNTIGSSTVACVVSAPTASCTDTGLTNGSTYYYKIFAKDTNGNYSATGTVPTGSPVTLALTTLATGTDPSNVTLAPGGAATMADAFTFQTAIGTDTITAITVSLGTGASAGVGLVEITDSSGATVYGSASNPASDTPAISLTSNITATTSATTYKIRVTPKSHAAMPAPGGAAYTVTALVSGWTGTNPHAGSDTAGATITIDNLSPGDVTSATASGSGTQTSLSWSNPADADLATIVVLRRQGSAVADTPVEGTSYSVGNTIGSSTVACVVSAPTAACTDTGLTSGATYYYKVYTKDANGNYSSPGVTPTGSPVTLPLTTIATGTDPGGAALTPGGAATFADAFTFQTATGTDAITDVTVSLGAGAAAGLGLVEITDASGVTVYGSVSNPVSDTPTISLSMNITATTTPTTYKVRVTPKSHASMPAPAGATYTVTASVSAWTGTNAQAGSDTAGTTITIDNQSPGNVTSAVAWAGSTQAFLQWTNPADADFSSVVVLRHAGSAVTDTPSEGATYSVGNTVGSSTVACVGSITSCTDSSLTTGTTYYYKIFAVDSSGNYSANGTAPTGSPVTPLAGISVTPTSGLSVSESGSTATFTVVLTSQPSANVTVGLSSSDTTEGTVSPSSVTFTSANWNTPQTVTITGVNDTLDDGDITYTIVTAAATSADGGYNGMNPGDVSVTTTDDDTSGFTVTPTSGLTTTEAGGSATFTIVLNAQPTANVTVGLSSSNTAEGTASPASVTFTSADWNSPQTVTVTGVDDFLVDGAVVYSIVTAAATSADANYNGLNASDVSVTNTDNDAAAITVSPTSGLTTTEAGGTATFTIVLTSQPTANVSMGLSSSNTAEGTVSAASVTFTSANWNTPQTVTVTGVDDFLDDGNVAYTVVTAAATSADSNYNNLDPSDVSVTNTDNDTSGFTVTPTSGLTTTEAGGSTTFTVVLTAQPTANVTVGVSSSNMAEGTVSPSSLTFTSANWNTPQTVTVTGVDDFLVDGAVAYTIITAAATSADANYNGLNPNDASVTNTDNDAAGFTVTPTAGLTTTEAGGTATFTVALTSQPTANVTFGVSSSNVSEGTVSPSSLTFTSGNWNTPQTVTVTGVNDFVVDGAVAYTIVTAAATSADGNYNALNPSDVSVTNTDNDSAGFTVSPTAGLTTTEAGGSATFTVTLTSQPTANVTIGVSSSNTGEGTVSPSSLTFTSGNWNTPQTVTVTGVDDFVVDGAVAYTVVTAAATSADSNYSALNPSDVSVTNTDNDAAAVTVTPTSGLTTTEAGGTATFTVVLTSQPTANVTVGVSSSNTAEGTVSPASLTFTSANWSTPQTVTVTGVDDFVVDSAVAYSIVTAAASSADGNYNGLNPSDVSVTNTDNDSAGFTVTPTSGLTTTEAGGTSTFTMQLNSQPVANVTTAVVSSNLLEGIATPAALTFTSANWNTPQTVTVTGVDDLIVDGPTNYTILTAAAVSTDPNYSGLNPSDVSVTNTDNDVAGITVTPTSGLTTTEAGGTASFTLVLTSQPVANVTIGLSSSNAAEGTVAPSSITFTSANWSTPQTVTVTGVDDFLVDGAVAYTIVTSAATSADPNYSGFNASDVSVTNTDNDVAGFTVTPTSGLTTTEGGGTATFTIVLTSQPTANVTVGLSSSNTAEGTVAPSSVTFTSGNWNTPQTVTITGVDDFAIDGAVAYTIVTAAATSADAHYNGLNAADVSVTNTDNDTAGLTVTPTTGLTTTESGGTATFTMVMNTLPTANVTVALSSSNTAEGTVAPASVTFTPANWNTPQTITVTGVDDYVLDGPVAYTIVTAAAVSTDTNYSALNVADVSVTNTDNDTVASLQADLAVAITDGVTETRPGQTLAYTVTVTNNGPLFSNGTTLNITVAGVTLGAWTCSATAGSSCPASGSGAVSATMNLLANGVATFHVAATVSAGVSDSVSATATVATPAGQTDPTPANNTASDVDNIEAPRIGVSVKSGAPTVSGPAAFDVTYTIDISNQGGVPAPGIQVVDNLASAFAEGKPTITMAAAPSATAPCAVNGSFTGIGDSSNLLSASTLGVGQSCSITFTVRVTYPSADVIPTTAQVNRITATAGTSQQARAEGQSSVKLVLPRVDITQSLTFVNQIGEEPIFDIGLRLVVRNTTEADAHNVQVTDNLGQTFNAGAPKITIQSGPTLELLTAPGARTAAPASLTMDANAAAAGLTLSPAYNGTTTPTLLRGDDTLPAGHEQAITMTVRVAYPSSMAIPVDTDLSNTAVVTTSVTPGGTVITRDESTDVTSTAADPQSTDTPHPTVIRLTPAARLVVQKVASMRVAEIGDTVQYAVRVSNVGSAHLPVVSVTDRLPLGFRYVDGSARLLVESAVATRIPDPVNRGGVLTFTIPAQDTNAATITYRLRVGPGADRSDGVNIAQATSGTVQSGTARAKVQVAGGVFSTDACIIGKIFADLDGNGVQRTGEPGIPGVHLTLEDGTTLISDGAGQYSYCGLSPTTHVITVDRLSLPRGAVLVPASSRNAGDGRSQFVDVKNGELRRVDFVEASRDRAVLAEIEARRAADAEWRPNFAVEQRPQSPVAQAAAADASRTFSIGGTSSTLAEMLAPARQNMTGSGVGGPMAPSPGMAPVPFTPGVRSMLVVGLLDGVLSLNTVKGPNRFAVSPGTAFERELTRLSGTFADGRGRYAGRGALFLKGQVTGDIGITVAYDSEKATGTSLFRDIQPEAFYPITGDSSRKIFDAQSSSRFYARIEHGRSFGLFGDILATTLGGDARRLGTFNRALTGVQSRVETGRLTVAGFASRTALRQVVDEIAALGLSGPYSVTRPNGVSGSERVEIITRDRNQPAVVIQSQPLTRLTDYEFEPFTGRLLFRRPIPSLDERMNPVSIRVTYEVDATLDGAPATKAWVGGVDSALRLSKAVEFGGAWIDDETSGQRYRLRSVNGTIRFGAGTTLILEGAQSSGTAASGALLTTLGAATSEGAAARLELKHHSSRVLARAFVASADQGFSNPSAGLTPGRTEAGASAVATLTPSVKIVADAVHSEDLATGATRDGGMVAVDATIARALGVEVGVRRSVQSATSGSSSLALAASSADGFGLGPNGTAIDPVSGLPLSRPGLTSILSTGAAAASPALDETTVRGKVIFMPSKRANVYAEAEQDIRDAAKRMAAVGLQVQVSTMNRAYARHEFISSLDSPYALTPSQRRDATIIGLASSVTANSDVFSEYRMRNAIDGRDAEAAIGLRNQWTLADGLHVSTSIERLQTLTGTERESTAVTGDMDYTRLSNLKATTRLEWRQDLTTQSWLSTLGVAERLSSSWSLLARNYYQWVQQRSAAAQMQNRFSIGGAFRNPNSNRLNMLSRYELRVERTSGQPDGLNTYRRVQSVSTHVDYQPARGWMLSGQHAAKWVDDRTDGSTDTVRAQLLSGRLGVDLFRRLDVGALGSVLWGSSGGREQALGAEVGVLLRGNWWLSFGDNAVGFRDTDFDIANTTTRGPFTRLRLKFD